MVLSPSKAMPLSMTPDEWGTLAHFAGEFAKYSQSKRFANLSLRIHTTKVAGVYQIGLSMLPLIGIGKGIQEVMMKRVLERKIRSFVMPLRELSKVVA